MFISNKNQSSALQNEPRQELVCTPISYRDGNLWNLIILLEKNIYFSMYKMPWTCFYCGGHITNYREPRRNKLSHSTKSCRCDSVHMGSVVIKD